MNSKKNNVLIYIPYLNQEYGGIRQYSAGLIQLIATLPNYNFYILHENNDPVILDIINSNKNLKIVTTKDFNTSILITIINRIILIFNSIFNSKIKFIKSNSLKKLVKKYKINIIHCPYQFIPEIKNVKLICTMHDVQEIHFPEFFSADERALRAVNFNNFIRNSDIVIVSYKHIKEDIVKYFQKDQNSVKVVLLKMNNLWFKKFEKKIYSKLLLKLPFAKYLFYPANMWVHKNHKKLIEAIQLLKDKNLIVNFVFSGDFKNNNGANILKLIENYNLQSQVQVIGIVPEDVLYSLYKNTWGVVIPTLYEAGSFPLMESILLDIPVICSNTTSLPDTIGNKEFVFDPNNVQSIADKIEALWVNENYRNQSMLNLKLQKNKLIETNAEVELNEIYKSLLN